MGRREEDGSHDARARVEGPVCVVTDSTACLAPQQLERHGIRMVPLQVVVGGVAKTEGTQVGPGEVAEALRRHVPVSTSRPSPQAFLDVYRSAADDGASHVVSVHLSRSVSGTVDAARLAAKEAPLPVDVVDSRSLGMGLGFAVLAAAEAAAAGSDAKSVVDIAAQRAASSAAFFYVDTLEYLRRGGRVGAASAMVGTALAIKPLLHLSGGVIEPLEKVRTSGRAVARLEDLAVGYAGDADVDMAVHHLDHADRAQALATRLSSRISALRSLVVAEVGAVIGAHVGPGLLAVVVSPLAAAPHA
ncbi:DegV family protein [Actinobacteria bacterium YIM 96077]|uniref:Fatty acid-binding protein DegV n=1 Tax=Phytoactinopolyspora halophila TaxID=1981511 RepID=A0A329QF97_9ACTN|nr:DegV family protein [Phytoactinopolyspora halophila]AYY14102.1 DegV family protein [Actinobacteria bacterium YIM 96077]RAW09962.1 fatty acid-binding protein DegV [Phytoactinopolyspora halophila]